MYIRKIEIKNIKGIEHFVMDLSAVTKPGWHVLIGDNGSGKTTVLRGMGLMMMELEFPAVFASNQFRNESWRGKSGDDWSLSLDATENIDPTEVYENKYVKINYQESNQQTKEDWNLDPTGDDDEDFRFGFASGYGTLRILYSGKGSLEPRFSFFETLFHEEGLSTKVEDWIIRLKAVANSEPEHGFEHKVVIDFINASNLLPGGVTLIDRVGLGGIKFLDAAGAELYLQDAATGYRSMLTLVIDLLKNMITHFGAEVVKAGLTYDEMNRPQINQPGVVMIDEVDSHLHPTWQTRIGEWFTTHFPKIQFIVTTHSPLICRGAAKGTIWKLPALGSAEETFEIIGTEKDRLVYGTVLDAFETDEFGKNISRGDEGKEKQKRYRELMMKRRFETPMTVEEKEELIQLQRIFQSNAED